jgi:hypothetical protein
MAEVLMSFGHRYLHSDALVDTVHVVDCTAGKKLWIRAVTLT